MRNRRAVSPIALAVLLLALVAVALFVQSASTRQVTVDVHRAQLGGLARLQASSALAELRAQVAADANRPGTALFRLLRDKLDEPFERLDLSGTLRMPARALTPSWGPITAREADGSARGGIATWGAAITGTRSSRDVGASEEWVGLLELSVEATMSDAAGRAKRRVRESYEVRTVLAGPPRPFDQMGLFLGRLDVLTQAAAANRARSDLLALAADVERLGATLPADVAAQLGSALALPPAEEVARRAPALPEDPAVVWGFFASELALGELDLARDTARDLEPLRAKRAALAGAVGPAALARDLLASLSAALNRVWQYQRTLTVLSRAAPSFDARVGRWLARLTPSHFLDRAHLAVKPGSRLFEDWLAGRARVEGVIDATGFPAPLRLTGELAGRAVLVVGRAGADLVDLNRAGGQRLTIVSLGGPVAVSGEAHASVLALPSADARAGHGRISIPASAKLVGSLIVPDPASGALALEGRLRYDPELLAPYPPRETLAGALDPYVIAISPAPLFTSAEE